MSGQGTDALAASPERALLPERAKPLDLSLAIPCYREEGHLEQSIDALCEVLDGTRWSYEIVLVDDKSPDRTREVIERVCARRPNVRGVFHEVNRGRGAAFKTGYRESRGRITGFLDIDLEVHARYVPALVQRIDTHGVDVATGFRHYLLSQTGGVHREALSRIYRALCRFALGLRVQDSETGIKFFRRGACDDVVLNSESDGWFWDTEVMSRAELTGLSIEEVPVLFLRRYDKESTVRIVRDSWDYLKALWRFRDAAGMSLWRSPIYWSPWLYDLSMRLLQGAAYDASLELVASQIPAGASVVDVCSGSCRLYREHLRGKGVKYRALDGNGRLVAAARRVGIDARLWNAKTDPVPEADVVVMTSSLYHFHDEADSLLERMKAAARQSLLVSEPVQNLSAHPLPPVRALSAWLSDPGVGAQEHAFRYDLEGFKALMSNAGAGKLVHAPGDRNALAVFERR